MCNASPISDLNPLLMAIGAQVKVASVNGQRSVSINADFFTGYKQTALRPNEVLLSILLPFSSEVCFNCFIPVACIY